MAKKIKAVKKDKNQICLAVGQMKTVLDHARGEEEEVCEAAQDLIEGIDEGFEKRTKISKKKKKSLRDRWL